MNTGDQRVNLYYGIWTIETKELICIMGYEQWRPKSWSVLWDMDTGDQRVLSYIVRYEHWIPKS